MLRGLKSWLERPECISQSVKSVDTKHRSIFHSNAFQKSEIFSQKKRKEERTGCDLRFSSERLNLVKRFSFKNFILRWKQTKAMRDFRCWLPVEAFSFKCNSRSSSLNRSELWAAASNCSIRGEFARPSESIFAIFFS